MNLTDAGRPSLLKTEYIDLPLRITKEQAEFFQRAAAKLNMSRNGAIVFALRFGAPIVAHIMRFAESQVHDACERITAGKVNEKLGVNGCTVPAVSPSQHGTEKREPTGQGTGLRQATGGKSTGQK